MVSRACRGRTIYFTSCDRGETEPETRPTEHGNHYLLHKLWTRVHSVEIKILPCIVALCGKLTLDVMGLRLVSPKRGSSCILCNNTLKKKILYLNPFSHFSVLYQLGIKLILC